MDTNLTGAFYTSGAAIRDLPAEEGAEAMLVQESAAFRLTLNGSGRIVDHTDF